MSSSGLSSTVGLFEKTLEVFDFLLNQMSDRQRERIYGRNGGDFINDSNIDEAIYLIDSIRLAAARDDSRGVIEYVERYGPALIGIGEFFIGRGNEETYEIDKKMKECGHTIIALAELYSPGAKGVA